MTELRAGGGLRLHLGADGESARVAWGEPDWLGALSLRLDGRPHDLRAARADTGSDALGAWEGLELEVTGAPLRAGVRAYRDRPLLVFRLEAREALEGFAGERFDAPRIAWPHLEPAGRQRGGLPEGAGAFAWAWTEFFLPSPGDPATLANFLLLPNRPAAVTPLLLRAPDGRTLLVAPLGAFHEQLIAVPRGADHAAEGVRCGWHGDLDEVPAGFTSELAVWGAPSARRALAAWGAHLQARNATRRPGRYEDAGVARLSYWTDNGATYWYRTEAPHDVPGTLEAVAESLRAAEVPFDAFQLDSWFYPHAELRPFDDPATDVPPTGMLRWEARPDILPDGIRDLRRRLGDPPLILHTRHFSAHSPYFAGVAEDAGDGMGASAWRDGDRAHPTDERLYERMLDQALQWGAITLEHDWLIECFLGVRALRSRAGRAQAWQEGIDRAAARRGLTLQWCMASPADLLRTVTLERVTSIRTSGDYRYHIGNAANWAWFLFGNTLARALGLQPYKDVFLSNAKGSGRDGDPYAEVEALLAALSTGPVGIGDRIGRTDREVVMRTCRADGVLVKPDVPLAALDRSFAGHPVLGPNALVAEAHTRHADRRWHYLVALNAWRAAEPLEVHLSPADLGELRPPGAVVAYDWRAGHVQVLEPGRGIDLTLAPSDDPLGCWVYLVLAPLLDGEVALVGDPGVYATAGDRRIGAVRSDGRVLAWDVAGAGGETVTLCGWAARRPSALRADDGRELPLAWDESGLWSSELRLARRGWNALRLQLG